MSGDRGRGGVTVVPALMVVLTVCGLMVVLTGCGGSGGQDDGPEEGAGPSSTSTPSRASGAGTPAKTEQPSSPSSPATSGATAADGTDVGACFDGRCDVAVSKPMTLKVDSRFGVGELRITKITDDSVVLQSSGPGTFLSASVGEGGTGGLNALGFRVKSLNGGTAVLEFFPKA
ncbi:hypothetical protein ABT063_03255 [Streptomyces sp. NPDC002838]|uniref:hypothetical protein n=1 Tax=Streptomyces sp. NPDC002838 TaxID=3154436 RepID=UPI003321C17E